MGFTAVLLMGVALSMDACAVGMTNGMTDPKMPLKRTFSIALFFGFFQFLMPLIGYFITSVVADAFGETFEKISSWISFILLAFLGGKMIYECVKEWRAAKKQPLSENMSGLTSSADSEISSKEEKTTCGCGEKKLSLGKLFLQAIATSIDALAAGVVLCTECVGMGVWGATSVIGVTTFFLVSAAVYIGKAVGDTLADKASFCGGLVLIAIGLKILIEGLL